ncbi:carbohydrate kinase [Roseobacter denitrificans]|uniref:FGGY family of carbohydrate kinases n=1 Tax=Roseobacter denitrificans (strain ATCC 33942 / OCh 114) TaxID=375451 RepID=Q162I2_ROSDO|nr:FGGY-family carbohydrate kinase [Roseobacter denitrificans]ABG33111.1 FGGY family of carbohydrate kinases [Roseobacter denitrificans OCh 114]AVL52478.1 carbohydrate kinase [Roseobacter denitrificans]SFG07767.1 erythritol kinase (L-erythritol 4-phosphate-forming) [Roseobacter denitrificans OCh 114]
MTAQARDILIGIDAGTSVIKSVAFLLDGTQIAVASVPNRYTTRADGAAFQCQDTTWADCARTLRDLADKVPDLARRTAALAVTGQGDGTWLVGKDNRPVTDAWLWLDARSAATAASLRATEPPERFQSTGTGLNACQMGAQLAHMDATMPEVLDAAEVALHCKDWMYLNLTGVRATDPSEANFTFGSFRTRAYSGAVIASLGLTHRRGLLPEIVDGAQQTHGLSAQAAAQTGLLEGTPVALAYVDVACTGMGAGLYTPDAATGCTIVGSTGMHMRATPAADVTLSAEPSGYVMVLPVPDLVAQIQTNMASTLNIDWLLGLGADLIREMGGAVEHADLVARIEGWLARTNPGEVIYHPYISEAGERGPFTDTNARAAFMGLGSKHGFADLLRAVIEGLGYAARDCYDAMGGVPTEVRLTGGAARSAALRKILSAALGANLCTTAREEAGAAGAAMTAAVAIGAYSDMNACIADWVQPLLGPAEAPDADLAARYSALFPSYRTIRTDAAPIWATLAATKETHHA